MANDVSPIKLTLEEYRAVVNFILVQFGMDEDWCDQNVKAEDLEDSWKDNILPYDAAIDGYIIE